MEYQAKELFATHDVPVTVGTVITSPEEAVAAAVCAEGYALDDAQIKPYFPLPAVHPDAARAAEASEAA